MQVFLFGAVKCVCVLVEPGFVQGAMEIYSQVGSLFLIKNQLSKTVRRHKGSILTVCSENKTTKIEK